MTGEGWYRRARARGVALVFLLAVGLAAIPPTRGEDSSSSPEVPAARNWLVLIAINEYPRVRPLSTPIDDVAEIKRVLHERYTFDPAFTLELIDESATRLGIYGLFRHLNENVGPQDTVLLYYAGHGYLDDVTSSGYWIPYDGGTEFGDNWLSDTAVTGTLLNLKAKHAFVIADSCFSGNLLNQSRDLGAQPEAARERYEREFALMSRVVLTSGNLEPVADVGSGNHSPFALQVIRTLEQNTQSYLDADDLYYRVRAGVSGQQPLMGALKGAGHQQGGSYVFTLKGAKPLGPVKFTAADAPAPFTPATQTALAEPQDPTPEIWDALRRFEAAYEDLDLQALRSVWPSTSWTKRTFAGVKGYEIEIPEESVNIEPLGEIARVDCVVRITPTGRRKQWREYGAEFELRRDGDEWIIAEYRVQID